MLAAGNLTPARAMSRNRSEPCRDRGCPCYRLARGTHFTSSFRVGLGIGSGGREWVCRVLRVEGTALARVRGSWPRRQEGVLRCWVLMVDAGLVRWNGEVAPCAGSATG